MSTSPTFQQIIEQIQSPMYRLAFMFTKDAHKAEDIVQDAMIKIWRNQNQIPEILNLKAWALRITRNLCIDDSRRKKEDLQPIEEAQYAVSHNVKPDRQAEINDQMSLVQLALQELSENQRIAIQLREIEGHTYQEIADMMEENINQVKILIYRGRQKMKSFIQKRNTYGIS